MKRHILPGVLLISLMFSSSVCGQYRYPFQDPALSDAERIDNLISPKSITQLPAIMDYNIRNGRTYMYFNGTPLYPFGYGLSYTSFEYSNLKTASILPEDGSLKVIFDVKNTGEYGGDEVVQLYVRYLNSSVERPAKQLKSFARIPVSAGENKSVTLTLKAEDLAYWDEKKHSFIVEPGKIEIMIVSSSQDIRLRKTISVVRRIVTK